MLLVWPMAAHFFHQQRSYQARSQLFHDQNGTTSSGVGICQIPSLPPWHRRHGRDRSPANYTLDAKGSSPRSPSKVDTSPTGVSVHNLLSQRYHKCLGRQPLSLKNSTGTIHNNHRDTNPVRTLTTAPTGRPNNLANNSEPLQPSRSPTQMPIHDQ